MYNSNEAQDIRDLATQVHDCWRNIYTIKIIPKGSHFFIILVIIFSYSFWYYMTCVLYLVLCASIVWYICLIGFVHTFFCVPTVAATNDVVGAFGTKNRGTCFCSRIPKGWWKKCKWFFIIPKKKPNFEKLLELIQMKLKFEEFLWLKYEQQRDRYIDRYKYCR